MSQLLNFFEEFAVNEASGCGCEAKNGGDDKFEHGDVIDHAKDEDASGYSMHQFLAADDGALRTPRRTPPPTPSSG